MLSADYICGLVDGEGSFTVYVVPRKIPENRQRRVKVEARFMLKLQGGDLSLLEVLHDYFRCGRIYFQRDRRENHVDCYRYEVYRRDDNTNVIIPFFLQYELRCPTKIRDFQIFATIVAKLNNEDHLTEAGLEEIRNLKDCMHRGSPDAGNPHVRWGSLPNLREVFARHTTKVGNARRLRLSRTKAGSMIRVKS